MMQGDLIYIPQDVTLFDLTDKSYNTTVTEKPTIGIFLRRDAINTYRVYAQGREASVETRHAYPLENTHAS